VRLRGEPRALLRISAIVLLTLAPLVSGTPARAAAQEAAFDQAAVTRALDVIRADQLLRSEKTIRTLRWREAHQKEKPAQPGWLTWFVGFFAWLGQSGRYLVWAAAAILVVLVVRYVLATTVRQPSAGGGGDDTVVVPTHVRNLDIRPVSLPPDIGAAARALWDEGQHRAALALLYRGLLSRLAHVHSVPIQDSTTEGDCLALSGAHLEPPRYDYVARLVRVWQHGIYGHEEVSPGAVHDLCDGFATALDRRVAAAPSGEVRS
jgi:hypothetical protein